MPFSNFSFDLILPDLKVSRLADVLERLAQDAGRTIGLPEKATLKKIQTQLEDASADLDNGCLLFDIRASNLVRPFMALARVKRGATKEIPGDKPVDIVCVLVSPETDGVLSLQKLSRWARLLKSEDFLKDLRAAGDADDIRILMSNPRTRLISAA